jgi:mannose-6-phosphate isomerase-like protein (cupin superfamily)
MLTRLHWSDLIRNLREAKSMAKRIPSAQRNPDSASPDLPGPVSRKNAEHYRWGVDCDAWYLVNDEQLSVIEEFMPPGAAEIRHHHQKAQQFFYILSGEVIMEVEGQTTLLAAGTGIRVLPEKRHQIRNPSSVPVRFLVVSHPRSHGDRIDD